MAGGAHREGINQGWMAVGYRSLRHALVSWVHMCEASRYVLRLFFFYVSVWYKVFSAYGQDWESLPSSLKCQP